MICKSFSIEQKKEILDRAHGQYFSCSWVKKDLTERKAVCKKWQAKYLHGVVGENKNPVAHIPHFYTIAEDAVEGYRNVDLRTLKHARVGGIDYEFIEE